MTDEAVDPDLLIDFTDVALIRDGHTLVGPVTWSVELDERWVIIGANGAGKTSLLRIAAAAEHPTSGVAYVLGERLGRVDMSELRSRVGLSSSALAQRIPGNEIVRDLVVSAGYAVLGRWRERYEDVDYNRAVDMLESLGAEHLADRRYETLSEGERKRILIARALMTDPELLLLDEPAAGLDLGGREELVARLADLAADPDAPALVLVTHHVEEIPPGFSHCMLLSEGKVVSAGLLSDVLTGENLSAAFGQSIDVDVLDGRYFARRTRTRAAHRRRSMTDDTFVPLPVRPAATVMLVRERRESPAGIDVFLMRRHPGDGIRRRDRWCSPAAASTTVTATPRSPGPVRRRRGGRSGSAPTPIRPRRWCAPPHARPSRSAACCSPDRSTTRAGSSATRRSIASPGRRWPTGRCRSPIS